MLSLAHTVISLPLGVFLQHPILVFFVAVASHYLLDSIYHWNVDPADYKKFPVFIVGMDILGGLLIAWILLGGDIISLPILAAIAGSNTPDVIQTLWILLGKPRSKRLPFLTYLLDFHDRIQWETKNKANGLIFQLAIILIAILLLF